MRTPMLVGIVVAVHCVAVGSAVLIQGCRTPQAPKSEPVVLTETTEMKKPEAVPQVVLPVVEAPKVEAAPSVETTPYVVAKGDSLSIIAFKYGLKVPEVMALNGMTNPNKLRVGQKLMLPGTVNIAAPKRHVAKKAKTEEARPEAGEAAANEYTVEPGDSLSKIAVKHGTTVTAIKKANNMTSTALKAGQKIMVPGAVKEEQTEKTNATPAAEPMTIESAAPAAAPADAATPAPVAEPAAVTAPVQAGQPAAMSEPAPATAAAPVAAASAGKTQSYTVEPNDDLVKVSKMWGVSVDELKKLNKLTDSALKPSQVLLIPIVE